MDLLKNAKEFLKRSMSNMSTSDRVSASREAKTLVLNINEVYKENKDPKLMDVMKLITQKKRKIDKRLRGLSTL
ncbi:hypothetical protein [Aquimarina litoralis]|uniref:hypothetical protein n=1 Tax=Aquimarina litoralis TaxID=584605 RepID=UPI001C564BE1|nr:hypothetical protein [Aquimarina litoralis]MBW1297057.1 hypothetical protein [Aquimarina litoralis]